MALNIRSRINDFMRVGRRIGLKNALIFKLKLGIRKTHLKRNPRSANNLIHFRIKNYPGVLYYRALTSDIQVFYHIFIYNQFHFLRDIHQPQLIIDCGAYVGYSTLYFLKNHPTAQVIAIELDPDNYSMCARNLAPFGERVVLKNGAVWSSDGKIFFEKDARQGNWGTHVQQVSDDATTYLPSYSMNTILSWSESASVDLLKMDIEGAEKEIFKEPHAWLPAVRNLTIELHDDECLRVFNRAFEEYECQRFPSGEMEVCRSIRLKEKG